MNKHLKILLVFIGLIGLFTSCENDGMKVVMLDNPIAPSLTTVPDLNLQRSAGNDTLTFSGTPVDPGFQASANYFLEACATGTDFADPVVLTSDIQDSDLKITVGDLNTQLLKKFDADKTTSIDLRIRAVLVVDAGTGAIGTSSKPLSYNSEIMTVDATPYGLPRLDLIGSGIDQKIESALGDGSYTGYVKLDVANPFTLNDPDTNTSYGDDGNGSGTLKVDGSAIAVPSDPGNGWYKVSADINALTYSVAPYMIGLIGDATPNGWSAPDSKMDYNSKTGLWEITLDLTVGSVKFRLNDDWTNGINLGIGDGYSIDNLWNSGSSANIPIDAAGNYTIKLSIGSSKYSCTITKNN